MLCVGRVVCRVCVVCRVYVLSRVYTYSVCVCMLGVDCM